jgi:hypothetical protein
MKGVSLVTTKDNPVDKEPTLRSLQTQLGMAKKKITELEEKLKDSEEQVLEEQPQSEYQFNLSMLVKWAFKLKYGHIAKIPAGSRNALLMLRQILGVSEVKASEIMTAHKEGRLGNG